MKTETEISLDRVPELAVPKETHFFKPLTIMFFPAAELASQSVFQSFFCLLCLVGHFPTSVQSRFQENSVFGKHLLVAGGGWRSCSFLCGFSLWIRKMLKTHQADRWGSVRVFYPHNTGNSDWNQTIRSMCFDRKYLLLGRFATSCPKRLGSLGLYFRFRSYSDMRFGS